MATPNSETFDKRLASPPEHNPSYLLLADAHANAREIKVSSGNLSSVNASQEKIGANSITRFPNGVKFCTDGNVTTLVPPPGGTIGGGESGGMTAYDSNHRPVAELDQKGMLRVQTKNGEYIEDQSGSVTFKSNGDIADLRTLHKPGQIPAAKLENYGVSTDGTVTRYPNGIEFNPRTNQVTVPADYPNFRETNSKNNDGSTTRQGFDGNGKLLYSTDGSFMRVPTADGTLTQNAGGTVSFDSASSAVHTAQKVLPHVELFSPTPSKTLKATEDECSTSRDPICGLDLGKF